MSCDKHASLIIPCINNSRAYQKSTPTLSTTDEAAT